MKLLIELLPALCVLIASVVVLWGSHWFLIRRQSEGGNERLFPAQLMMLGLTFGCVLALVVALPENSPRREIIGLIGILLSGMIAFSSTNVVANLMAGILLRITKPFKTGDFIRVNDFFGRVSERGLFDTEIQSETRELIAIPNTYLVSNPVSTTRSSGAIVSANLSLGYDVHHSVIEPLLIKAAEESGLAEPFVHMLDLGDFSIKYRISGLLTEVKGLVTARSRLRKAMVGVLHDHGIEIMSPTYVNQRRVDTDEAVVPAFAQPVPERDTGDAEAIIFDKAEQAEQIENEKQALAEGIKLLENSLKDAQPEEKAQIKEEIEAKRARLKAVEQDELEANTETAGIEPIAPADADKPPG